MKQARPRALHGHDTDERDRYLLIDPIDGVTTLTSLVRTKRKVEALIGATTDVLTPMALHERFRNTVIAEAAPV